MTFQRIDELEDTIEGYSWLNYDGHIETVETYSSLGNPVARINLSTCEPADVYHADIPKLIKALQAVLDKVGR
jgi:hypothetical protein